MGGTARAPERRHGAAEGWVAGQYHPPGRPGVYQGEASSFQCPGVCPSGEPWGRASSGSSAAGARWACLRAVGDPHPVPLFLCARPGACRGFLGGRLGAGRSS
ncbi:hypothetical protein C2E23DRAFT_847955 [Lenzites betulinus]|nr:hypothetical protein C2E23DRAFT_847955 [Lenzites betulinus]